MSTPQERIEAEVLVALRAGEKERLGTLRLLLAAIKNERIRLGKNLDENGFVALVRKAIKQRVDSADQYRQGRREDLAAHEDREAEILSKYVPPEAEEAELEAAIRKLVTKDGLSGPAAIGPVMNAMLTDFAGRADGGVINRLARKVLAESD